MQSCRHKLNILAVALWCMKNIIWLLKSNQSKLFHMFVTFPFFFFYTTVLTVHTRSHLTDIHPDSLWTRSPSNFCGDDVSPWGDFPLALCGLFFFFCQPKKRLHVRWSCFSSTIICTDSSCSCEILGRTFPTATRPLFGRVPCESYACASVTS